MQPAVQPALRPEPKVFRYSLDWRFLLPLADPAGIQVVCADEPGFGEALGQVGIPLPSQPLSAGTVAGGGDQLQALVYPFGLPVGRVSAVPEEQVEFLRALRSQLCPGGYLLLGFHNSWTSRSHGDYHAATPRRMASHLSRAGFQSIKVLGVLSDLRIPEYIFELNAQAIRFALQHRFRRKSVLLSGLHIFACTVGLARISDFLPCYFALAIA